MQTINIMIVGVGGQGTLLTSRVLGKIALTGGYDVKLSEVHGMAQRGGSVVTYVRYGDSVAEPIVEEGQADILIAFERLEALRYAHFLKPTGAIIVNDTRIDPMSVVIGAAEYPEHILENLQKKYKVLSWQYLLTTSVTMISRRNSASTLSKLSKAEIFPKKPIQATAKW